MRETSAGGQSQAETDSPPLHRRRLRSFGQAGVMVRATNLEATALDAFTGLPVSRKVIQPEDWVADFTTTPSAGRSGNIGGSKPSTPRRIWRR